MSKYIKADELISHFNDWALQESPNSERDCHVFEYSEWNLKSMIYRTIKEAIKGIQEQPAADVIPIEWIKEQKDKCFPNSITAIALKHLLAEWERREDAI